MWLPLAALAKMGCWVHTYAPMLGVQALLLAISALCWSQCPAASRVPSITCNKLSPTSAGDVFLVCWRQSPSYSLKSSAGQGLAVLRLHKSKHLWWILVFRPNPAPGSLPCSPLPAPLLGFQGLVETLPSYSWWFLECDWWPGLFTSSAKIEMVFCSSTKMYTPCCQDKRPNIVYVVYSNLTSARVWLYVKMWKSIH